MTDYIDFRTVLAITLTVILVFGVPVTAVTYYGACRQASVYNTLHHTQFTCGDFFWASNQINSNTQTLNVEQ